MKLVAALAVLVALAATADAHDLRPGVLSLTEQSSGDYALHFAPPIDSRGDATEISIDFPAGCTRNADLLHCDGAIAGTLAVRGMRGAAMKTLVILVRASGERSEWILDTGAPQIT